MCDLNFVNKEIQKAANKKRDSENAIQETQIQVKLKAYSGKRRSQGFIKAKATRLLKFLARIIIDSNTRKEIFVLKGQGVMSYLGVRGPISTLSFWNMRQMFWMPVTVSGQKLRFHPAEMCISHTSSLASQLHSKELS